MSRIITLIFLVSISFVIASCDFSAIGSHIGGKRLDGRTANPFDPNQKLKVALVAPLSGKNGDIGRSLLDAANLAIHDGKFQEIDLIPIDSNRGNIVGALRSNNIQLVMGPLFAAQTKDVQDYAVNLEVPVLSFSNDASIANKRGVFILGILPSRQFEEIITHAKKQGYNNMITVVPYGRYGDVVESVVRSSRVNYVKGFEYSTDANKISDFNQTVAEIKRLMKPGEKYAILFPEAGTKLQEFSRTLNLSLSDAYDVRILGSSQWEGNDKILSPALNGSWYPSINESRMQGFIAKFRNSFGYTPNTIATLGYDATKITQALFEHLRNSGANTVELDYLYKHTFDVITGPIKFESNGHNTRNLAIIELSNGGRRVVSE